MHKHKYVTQVELDAARAMTQFALDRGERQHYIAEVCGCVCVLLSPLPCLPPPPPLALSLSLFLLSRAILFSLFLSLLPSLLPFFPHLSLRWKPSSTTCCAPTRACTTTKAFTTSAPCWCSSWGAARVPRPLPSDSPRATCARPWMSRSRAPCKLSPSSSRLGVEYKSVRRRSGTDLSFTQLLIFDAASVVQILKRVDLRLWRAVSRDGMEPQFALSWVLTWFAHDLRSLSQVYQPLHSLLQALSAFLSLTPLPTALLHLSRARGMPAQLYSYSELCVEFARHEACVEFVVAMAIVISWSWQFIECLLLLLPPNPRPSSSPPPLPACLHHHRRRRSAK